MTIRITDQHLEAKVDTINRMRGFNPETVSYGTIGALTLAGAYGGKGVHLIMSDGGGVRDLFGGYGTKREVAHFLDGMIHALRLNEPV